jgi:hypothetical protein
MRAAAYFSGLACFFIALNIFFGHGRDGLWVVGLLMVGLGLTVSVIGFTTQESRKK